MEITPTLPKYQTHKTTRWHPKFNSYNCNMSFVKMQRTQSLTRPTTHAAISTSHNSISSQYSQPFTSLEAPKANLIFHAANKNLFLKTPFDLRRLTSSSSSSFYFLQPSEGLTTLSEEPTQRKHTYVTPSFSLNTNQLLQLKSSYKNSGYKMVPSRYQQQNPVQKKPNQLIHTQ